MAKKSKEPKFGVSTLAVHGGEWRHGVSGPVATPIVRTSNFAFASTAELKRFAEGKSKEYLYTRYGNPTLAVAEEKLANLENGEAAIVTSSGMAAITSALLSQLKAGDELIATRQLYGGAYRFLRDFLPRFGVKVSFVDASLAGAEQLVTQNTRALYVESPTNPTLQLVDLKKAAALAKRHKLVAMIDNTFASPVLQKPLDMGFDLVLHSATKYLAGHSDLIAGAAAGRKELIQKVREMVIVLGGSMDPDAAYMLIRGMKTLEVRMQRQCTTAMAVAEFLESHPKVACVHYPGLPSHPDRELARRQMSGFGGMLACTIKGGLPAARRVCDRAKIFLLAASLGGIESLIVLPMYTSHFGMKQAELVAAGIDPGTVRISVGLESPEDLIADLRQALA